METMHAAGRRNLPPVPRPSTERAAPGDRPEPADQDGEAPTERFVVELATDEQRTVSAGTATTSGATASGADAPDADASADDQADASADDEADDAADREAAASADDQADDEADASADDEADREAAASADDQAGDEADASADDEALAATAPAADDASRAEALALDPGQHFVAGLRAAAADFAEAAGAESSIVREAVPPARHRRARCRLVLRYADDAEVDVTFLGPAGRPGMPSRHGIDRQILRWLAAGQRRDAAWLVTDPEASDGLAVDLSAWVAAA